MLRKTLIVVGLLVLAFAIPTKLNRAHADPSLSNLWSAKLLYVVGGLVTTGVVTNAKNKFSASNLSSGHAIKIESGKVLTVASGVVVNGNIGIHEIPKTVQATNIDATQRLVDATERLVDTLNAAVNKIKELPQTKVISKTGSKPSNQLNVANSISHGLVTAGVVTNAKNKFTAADVEASASNLSNGHAIKIESGNALTVASGLLVTGNIGIHKIPATVQATNIDATQRLVDATERLIDATERLVDALNMAGITINELPQIDALNMAVDEAAKDAAEAAIAKAVEDSLNGAIKEVICVDSGGFAQVCF